MNDYEVIHSKSEVFYNEYQRKADLRHLTHYCPGCGHGIAHKLIAEAIQDMGLQNDTIFVSPVGCSVFAYYYFDVGNVQVAHGRAPAAATGIARACPDKVVISYQGDGDLAAIGTAEIIHAANRGEKIAVFFVNNAIYGMTGGQLAPTTLVGQGSTTTPWGRRPNNEGFPLHVCELLAQLEMPVYIERVALSDNKNIMRARKAIRKALELQKQRAGFTLVEILSPCPTIWKKDAVKARKWVAEHMIPVFPLGVFRDRKPRVPQGPQPPHHKIADVLEIGEGSSLMRSLEAGSTTATLETHIAKDTPDTSTAKECHIKVAGFGGQGVLLLGQFLTEMGMREGMQVSWLPSYGPEMRGGSAHCHVCLSHSRIGSPLIENADVLIAMNELSLRKFSPHLQQGGLILYNGSELPHEFSFPDVRLVCVPASEIADLLGAAKVANIVMLGAFLALTQALPEESAQAVLGRNVKNHAMLDLDRRALAAGADYVQEQILGHTAAAQPDGYPY